MNKKRLSIFVDESGILNEPAAASRFYVLTLVLHDQDFPVDDLAAALDRGLLSIGIANLCFHAGPIIHAKDQFDEFVVRHKNEIDDFDDVKVYYDCGQKSITNFLHGFFESRAFRKVEFAQAVEPKKYRLFQVADLVCTLRLLELKLENNMPLSNSEHRFFGGEKKFRHDVLRKMKSHEVL